MIKELLRLKHVDIIRRPNYIKIPCTAFNADEQGAEQFNKIYLWAKQNIKNRIVRTRSGGISYEVRNFRPPMWDVRRTNSCVELTILIAEGMWRIQFRTVPKYRDEGGKSMYGRTAFLIFSQTCAKFGIDIDSYAITNGAEVKKEIEKPLIKLERPTFKDKVFSSVHHLDFHSSYPTGLINTHPEFKEAVEYMYERRHEDNDKFKLVLNATIGYMQSSDCCNAKWAHLSRDAINDNNKRIEELAKKLKESGRVILSYNTDGIWYQGEVYHDSKEGKGLGQWENDHINCTFRAKSAGSYEFIENGKYYPVVRGFTVLDRVKPRTEWEWGDIYRNEAEPVLYRWTDEDGLMRNDY